MSKGAVRTRGWRGVAAGALYSLDAANRAWMHGATYRARSRRTPSCRRRHRRGGVIESAGARAGDIVFGDTGWQDYAAVPASI